MRATFLLCLAAAICGCHNIEGKLDEVSWCAPVESDYESMVERARTMTLRRYPKGLDPDKTNEDKGDFYTVWDYKVAVTYRDTTRSKAHVKVEDGPGRPLKPRDFLEASLVGPLLASWGGNDSGTGPSPATTAPVEPPPSGSVVFHVPDVPDQPFTGAASHHAGGDALLRLMGRSGSSGTARPRRARRAGPSG